MATITVSNLRAKRRSPHVVVMQFLRAIQRKPQDEYLWVFEGQDIKYYAHRIEQFTGKQVRYTFIADGRSNVLDCLNRFVAQTELHAQHVAFFADRDVIPPPPSPYLYVTPTYSIENLYVSEDAFARALTSLFGLAEIRRAKEREEIIELYRGWSSKFSKALSDLMAWIYIQQTDLALTSKKLNLKSVPISKLYEIRVTGRRLFIKSQFGILKARSLFPNAPHVSSVMLEQKKTELTGTNWICMGRGKYWADFYAEVMGQLIQDSNQKTTKIFRKKHKVSVMVGAANLLDVFTSYADTPDCLKTFLTSRV